MQSDGHEESYGCICRALAMKSYMDVYAERNGHGESYGRACRAMAMKSHMVVHAEQWAWRVMWSYMQSYGHGESCGRICRAMGMESHMVVYAEQWAWREIWSYVQRAMVVAITCGSHELFNVRNELRACLRILKVLHHTERWVL